MYSKLVLVISAALLLGGITAVNIQDADAAAKGVSVCETLRDTNCLLSYNWDPDSPENESDFPQKLVVINGVLSKVGTGDRSTVQGQIEGMLVGKPKTMASETLTTSVGSTTITTTIESQSRAVNGFSGQVIIDDVPYDVQLKVTGFDATQLFVTEEAVNPTGSRLVQLSKLETPVMASICSDSGKCLKGFGTITTQINDTTNPSGNVRFQSDKLEATLIGEEGLFELDLLRVERNRNL